MRIFSLTTLLLTGLALLGGCMPGASPEAHLKQIARNEEKLREQGIIALEPGQIAPSFSAQGTGGSSLSIGAGLAGAEGSESAAVAEPAAPPETAGAAAEDAAGVSIEPAAEQPADLAAAESAANSEAASTPSEAQSSEAAGSAAGAQESAEPGSVDTGGEDETAAATGETGSALSGATRVLLFFPAPSTPNTAKQFAEFEKAAEKLRSNGLEVYGISATPLAELEAFAAEYAIRLPLLADPDGSISVAYGCLSEGGKFPQRTAVGIGPDGRILLYRRGLLTSQAVIQALKPGAEEQ